MAENKKPAIRPTAIQKLAEEADKRGYMLVPKEAKGITSMGSKIPIMNDGVGGILGTELNHLLTTVDINDFEAVSQAALGYFVEVAEKDLPPSVAGLCLRLGISRNVLNNWRTGKARDHRYKELAERCYTLMESTMMTSAMKNKVNPIMTIVQLKNHFGYTDEQKVVVESKESVVDDSMQMADVLAIAGESTPKKANYTAIDKTSQKR